MDPSRYPRQAPEGGAKSLTLRRFDCLAGIVSLAAIMIASTVPKGPTSPSRTTKARTRGEIRLTYLGNAGWQIEDGHSIILVDPYLSQFRNKRGTDPNSDNDEIITPDGAQIDSRVHRADYILITHAHEDHLLDAPYISNKTGAVIFGHETAANIARAYDVPDEKLITVRRGEDYDFDGFSLKVIPSLHSPLLRKRYFNKPWAGSAPRGLKAPLHESAFVEGGSLAYLLRIAGHRVLIMGTMNFIEREMDGLRPDVALVGAGSSRKENFDYVGRLLRALGYPAVVFPTHWDSYGSMSEEQARKGVEEFAREVKVASPKTRVIVPQYFQPIPLP